MRNIRVSMKKQQPNICKLRKFLNEGLNRIEEDLFLYNNYGRYWGENYVNNSRTKAVYLSYYYECLESISFYVKGKKPLIILSEYQYECEKEGLLFNNKDKDYKIISNKENLKDYITDEMKSIMHESDCRHKAQHKKFKDSREDFIYSFIKECLNRN